ncbi:MAG: AAA family ATPase [Candidatus Stahlbacteria bacterium]|nr:AAA family ATPase [Candidatus Stahlbacteria bacterium]
MKISRIVLHNFRSIKEQTFNLKDYSLLIGANNSGKTNIIDALRIFYEKEKIDKEDSPKFETADQESWIEIEYHLRDEEFANLKDEYKQESNTLKVRKYLKSSDSNRVKSNQSNIYGYEKDSLSDNLFYGAKNISEAKLGDVVYIPEVAKVDEYTKLSGPSAFRDSLNFVVKKVVKSSPSFETLSKSFVEFNDKFKTEPSKDGISIQNFIDDVNKEIKDWDISFGVEISQIKPEEIIKHLVSHYLEDKNLNDSKLDVSSFGQGLQRHLIYTLIKLSTKYQDIPIKKEKKEFAPEFTLILFEEPEAFLHPAQQEILNLSLKKLSSQNTQQVLISTHSPLFVSKNIEDVPSLLKLTKEKGETIIYQVDDDSLQKILKENKELKKILEKKITDKDLEEEFIRYSLWLDSERCSVFFADTILICEGATEKALIDYLIKNNIISLENKQVYILDAMGKYNIHRYMNLFNKLGIKHSVLFDRDKDEEENKKINEFIKNNKNKFTLNIHLFNKDLEDLLEVNPVSGNERYKKPLNVMWHYRNDKIKQEKIDELIKIVKELIEK